jgi:hypothetical protein
MRTIVGISIGALFIGAMIYAVMAESRVECKVCVVYRGETVCRTSTAADRPQAIAGAVASACAVLSSGVTDGIECRSIPLRSQTCSDG